MSNSDFKTHKTSLWREGLRCFFRNGKLWLKPALFLWLAQVFTDLFVYIYSLKGHALNYLFSFVGFVLFLIFFMKREPISDSFFIDGAKCKLIFRKTLPLVPTAIVLTIVALVLMNIWFLFKKSGFELPNSSSTAYSGSPLAQILISLSLTLMQGVGLLLFYGTIKYLVFCFVRFAVLIASGVNPPAASPSMKRSQFWRVAKSYILIWLLLNIPTILLMALAINIESMGALMTSSMSFQAAHAANALQALLLIAVFTGLEILGLGITTAFVCTGSRLAAVGFVPEENLVGKAEFLFFSLEKSASLWSVADWPWAVRRHRLMTVIN